MPVLKGSGGGGATPLNPLDLCYALCFWLCVFGGSFPDILMCDGDVSDGGDGDVGDHTGAAANSRVVVWPGGVGAPDGALVAVTGCCAHLVCEVGVT